MVTNLATVEDLRVLKHEIFDHIEHVISLHGAPVKTLLKSKDVRQMLGISHGTLQTLRINGTIPYTKVGGTIYYQLKDVQAMLDQNKHISNLKVKTQKENNNEC